MARAAIVIEVISDRQDGREYMEGINECLFARSRVFFNNLDAPAYLDKDSYDHDTKTTHLAAYEKKSGKCVGALRLRPESRTSREMFLEKLVVSPNIQRKGVARALVERAEMVTRTLGKDRLAAYAPENVASFFIRVGFRAIGKNPLRLVILEKRLSA